MKILLTLLTILLITATSYAQESRPRYVKVDTSKKVVKPTVSTRMVGARTFEATAYCLTGKMANGQRVHSGAIAADPRVLKLGTKVNINGMGTFVVKDTGGAIKGNRVDIWIGNCQAARTFGRRKVQLLIN